VTPGEGVGHTVSEPEGAAGPSTGVVVSRRRRSLRRLIITRAILFGLAAVGFYLVWPELLKLFSAWPQLTTLDQVWFAAVAVAEAASFVSLWGLTRVALGEKSWFAVGTAQLGSTAVSRVMPGGAAAGGAVQYKMLVEAGGDPSRVATGLTATNLLLLATLVALPVLSLPAILSGVQVDRGLVQAAIVGGLVFLLTAVVGGLLLTTERPLRAVARVVQRVLNRLRRHSPPMDDLPERLVEQRDLIRGVLGRRWKAAVLYAVGNKLLDFGALLAALAAVGSTPRPSLVLLAYVVAAVLGMIPITPGGLGFVEAGLVATLGLAGVSGGDAVLSVLAYRLVAFWAPLPTGGIAYLLFRRRFGQPSASPSVSSSR